MTPADAAAKRALTEAARQSEPPVLGDYAQQPGTKGRYGGKRAAGRADPHPQVSIVTVVRNGAGTLPHALESVLGQQCPGLEYLVIDGGSTDGTVEFLRASEDRIDFWISEPDAGISDAFNKGIALARGEFIGLLNSDDWYEPDAVAAAVEQLRVSGADIACGGLQYWEGDRRTYLLMSDPRLLERGMTIGHPTVFARRECYRTHGLFRRDFRLAMDYEWLLRASRAGARFVVVDRCLANMQGGGVGDRRWRDSQREVARARALHIPAAANAWSYHAYVGRRIFIGTARRLLDAVGLGIVRRAYHRWLSPIRITSSRDDRKS
jgi:glycosyltransferase involved in cell wall biosynthesis